MFLPKAAIFDLDGTLLDSMWVWRQIDADFLTAHGHQITPDYTDAIKCMGWEEGARYTIDRYGLSSTPKQVIEEWFDMCADYYRTKITMIIYIVIRVVFAILAFSLIWWIIRFFI